jgi:HSP20 family molecular chaperone IbpA
LPEHADVNAMSAKHKNGILLITLPKKLEVKKDEIREIEIL